MTQIHNANYGYARVRQAGAGLSSVPRPDSNWAKDIKVGFANIDAKAG